jgi:ESCRT-II complex subunit VPS22
MRGGMGLGGVYQQRKMQENYAKIGEQVEKESLQKLKEQLLSFSSNLEKFALKHKDEIKYNSDFREKFYIMCMELGVDPLSSTTIWNKNLNLTEFYYNLAIQIITISIALREKKGGLLEINELKAFLTDHRKSNDISNLDIQKAVESVSELKCGFQIIDLKDSKAIVTIPMQLSNDTNILINIASECRKKGCIGFSFVYEKTGMSKNRFEVAIVKLFNKNYLKIFYFSIL